MSEWTPGPWAVDRRGQGSGVKFSGYVHCDDATGSAVAMTRFETVRRAEEETLANAHLIAAAPCMYNAILTAIAEIDSVSPEVPSATVRLDCVVDDLRRILARARGEAQ